VGVIMFDLNDYVRKNHQDIIECKENNVSFYWDDAAVKAVYKMAGNCANTLNIDKQEYEDFIQDCCCHFFSYIIYKFDPNKNISITTFSYVAFQNLYRMEQRKKRNKKENISLETIIYKNKDVEISLKETLRDPNLTPEEVHEKEEYYNFMRKKLSEDKVLYMYYVEGKTQVEIAKELGITQKHVCWSMQKKREKIREEWLSICDPKPRGRR